MIKEKVQNIIDEVFPKIEKHYGFSKFQECTPYVELHKNIYEKYSGEEGAQGDEDSCHAEYCSMMNEISIYYPNMKSKKMVIQTLIHEYIHYLQSPTWFKRYYVLHCTHNLHIFQNIICMLLIHVFKQFELMLNAL